MSSLRISRVLAVAALGALVACGADSATGPTSADLSSVLGELSPSSIPGGSVTVAMNGVPSTSAITPSACAFSSSSQSFTCPTITTSGFTIARSFTLLDASGAPQSAYDKSTTAAVRVNSTVNGGAMEVGVADTSVMTLSGLLGGTHTLDGVDHAHLTGNLATGIVTTDVSTTIAGLVIPAQKGAYPPAGTITTTSALASSPTASATTIKLTFSGTSKVAVVITTALTTKSCTLDLANPAAGCI